MIRLIWRSNNLDFFGKYLTVHKGSTDEIWATSYFWAYEEGKWFISSIRGRPRLFKILKKKGLPFEPVECIVVIVHASNRSCMFQRFFMTYDESTHETWSP